MRHCTRIGLPVPLVSAQGEGYVPLTAERSNPGEDLAMARFPDFRPEGVIPACLLPFETDYAIDEQGYRKHRQDVVGVRVGLRGFAFRSRRFASAASILCARYGPSSA